MCGAARTAATLPDLGAHGDDAGNILEAWPRASVVPSISSDEKAGRVMRPRPLAGLRWRVRSRLRGLLRLQASPLILYTAITGRRDDLQELAFLTPGCRHVCFTDDPALAAPHWEMATIAYQHRDPVRRARWCKILAHEHFPDATYSIWMDATYAPLCDLWHLIDPHLEGFEIAAFPHFERTCIYAEAEVVIRDRLDREGTVLAHVRRLREAGYPEGNGLHETGIVLRRHSSRTAEFNRFWWQLVESGSRRDQLRFDFALWKCGLKCNLIRPGVTCAPHLTGTVLQPYFRMRPHGPGTFAPPLDGSAEVVDERPPERIS